MKNVFLGLALAALTVACATEQKASVEDATGPAVECTSDCEKACCLSECSGEKPAECSGEKPAECTGEKAAAKVCPVTGKSIN